MLLINRVKVGLIYNYNENWIAGAYYILNLIHALNKLEDEHKPELIIFTLSTENPDVLETNYPYLKFHQLNKHDFLPEYSKIERGINKLSAIFFNKNVIQKQDTKKRLKVPLDLIFPASNHIYFSKIQNKLFWITDFQEHFLPHFFSEEEIQSRKKHQLQLATSRSSIVFSSNDAVNHFKKFYPDSNAQTFVMQFAVTHPSYQSINKEELFGKFSIDRAYFFCPNQVWIHKNHITVLKAVKAIKEQHPEKDVLVVFSGKQYDNRNPKVFVDLTNYISENNLSKNVKFIGFIDRADQLQLMNYATAILQPSLFEGWSTSIEDAKAMNQFLIASNLPVHREQVKTNAVFFNPLDEKELAKLMVNVLENPLSRTNTATYANDIRRFGNQFIEITNKVISS